MRSTAWAGFKPGKWQEEINLRDFIQTNYTPYNGGEGFLAPATARTNELNARLNALFKAEQDKGGVLDIDTETVTSLLTYAPGYLDKEKEIIVGLQTDQPLKRGVNPFGGINMTRKACKAYGYTLSDKVEEEFTFRTISAPLATAASSPDCPTPMAGGGSSATTAGWRSMAWTI